MNIKFWLNGIQRQEEVDPGMLLIDFLREKGCYSVKRGCETANCGLCTVLMDEKPILSCSMLAARIDGKKIVTLEGLQKEAEGFIMNVIAMLRELEEPDEEQIKEYLAGNLCRCSGFVSQTASILKYLNYKKTQEEA